MASKNRKIKINSTPWLINESFEFLNNFLILSKEASYLIVAFLFQFLYQIIVLLRDSYRLLQRVQFSELVFQVKKLFVFFFLNFKTYRFFLNFVIQVDYEGLPCHIDVLFLPFLPTDSRVYLSIQWPKLYYAFIAFFLMIARRSPIDFFDIQRFCLIRFALK